ncbi:MAG: TetR/AcrR family transcriptional regulator [Candidatus Methanomethylophilaceae archaeon]
MATNEAEPKHTSSLVLAKRDKAKRTIAAEVIPIFLEKGYDNTTIKDIENATGMKVGSIYNLFEDKYDILRECFVVIYGSAFDLSREQFDSNADVVSALAFPLALELLAVSSNKKIAQLIDEGHRSRNIMLEIHRMKCEWIMSFSNFASFPIKKDDVRRNMLAVVGELGSFASDYRYNPHKGYSKELKVLLKTFCALFDLPMENIDAVVEATVNKLTLEYIPMIINRFLVSTENIKDE